MMQACGELDRKGRYCCFTIRVSSEEQAMMMIDSRKLLLGPVHRSVHVCKSSNKDLCTCMPCTTAGVYRGMGPTESDRRMPPNVLYTSSL